MAITNTTAINTATDTTRQITPTAVMALTRNLRAFGRLTFVQFKLFLREPVALFFNIFFPVFVLVLFGIIWGNAPGSSMFSAEYGYIDAQVPALAAMVIGIVALMTIPVVTATAREQKLLRRYQATPLPSLVYIAADVTLYLAIALLGMVTLVIVAKLGFGLRFAGNWLAVTGAFLFAASGFIAAGYIIASLAPTSRMAQVAGQILYLPMMFLSGAAMPLAMMPADVQQVANWLPLTHVVHLLQGLWFGAGWDAPALWVLSALLGLGVLISARVFRWE